MQPRSRSSAATCSRSSRRTSRRHGLPRRSGRGSTTGGRATSRSRTASCSRPPGRMTRSRRPTGPCARAAAALGVGVIALPDATGTRPSGGSGPAAAGPPPSPQSAVWNTSAGGVDVAVHRDQLRERVPVRDPERLAGSPAARDRWRRRSGRRRGALRTASSRSPAGARRARCPRTCGSATIRRTRRRCRPSRRSPSAAPRASSASCRRRRPRRRSGLSSGIDVAVHVAQLDEVEVPDRRCRLVGGRRAALARLARDLRERSLRREPVRLPQLVVGRHPVVAAALDVDRAEVRDAGEAVRVDDRRRADGRDRAIPGFGTWNSTLRSELSICSSLRYWRSRRGLRASARARPARAGRGLPNATRRAGSRAAASRPPAARRDALPRKPSSWPR